MSSRNSDVRTGVVAQSAYPSFALSAAVAAAAGLIVLPPYSTELAPNGLPNIAEGGQLYVLQCTSNMNVRFVGAGTVLASQTVTFAAASGTITLKVLNYAVSITATGTNATDAALLAAAVNSDPILGKFFTASNAAAVTTVAYKVPGAGANLIPFSVTGTNATAGGATLASGVGPTPAASATNAYFVTANQPYFVYRQAHHAQIDVIAAGAGTLQIFLGV